MQITIIDYKAGNVKSIKNMLRKIGVDAVISNKDNDILNADKLILPGVGSFDYGMTQLQNSGLLPILNKKVSENKTPILGICLGVQLFTKKSHEGTQQGLGWLDAETIAFDKTKLPNNYKIPHMGWTEIEFKKNCKLFDDMPEFPPRFYFVHSYHLKTNNNDNIIAVANYGYEFIVALKKDNIIGVQFHPEKSHKFGMQLLRNFVEKF
jgi:glutamine amidotransferase